MRRGLAAIAALLALGLGAAPLAGGATLQVPQAYPTIQSAIDAAVDGDTLLVAPGTYVENLDFLGKAITVQSTDGPQVTTIDGGQLGSVVTFKNEESPDSVLEGFTITNGSGTVFASVTAGGGIFCEGASPTIRGNIITENSCDLGGGVYCRLYSSPWIEGNLIRANVVERAGGGGLGGGICCEDDSGPTILENEIVENRSNFRGGGICCNFSSWPRIEGNRIAWNLAEYGGAGIVCMFESEAIILSNKIIENGNFPGGNGAGILCLEASMFVRKNEVSSNVGGGVTCYLSTATLRQNLVEGNAGNPSGAGGITVLGSECAIANNIIVGNEGSDGGGIGVRDSDAVIITNNTVTGNHGNGSGMYFWNSTAVVMNTIVWKALNWPQIVTLSGSDVAFSHCLIERGWPGGENIIDADPLFVDWDGGDYRLRIGSPCVDVGYNYAAEMGSVDFEGDPRIVNGDMPVTPVVDIGADELVPEVAARFGTVNTTGASLANVLFVNGSAGNRRRMVTVSVLDAVEASLVTPPSGPTPAAFALYAWAGEPELSTLTVQPHHLGVTGFPTPLQGTPPQPAVVWNNLGYFGRLGVASHPSTPAPSILFSKTAWAPATVTLQGFIQDGGSAADGPVSMTNAVVLKIVE